MSQKILTKYKAAAVHAEPGWFDLELSVQKTIKWINEAGKAGCKLIAFPETWIPGYPYWMWKINYQESLPFIKAYRENSLDSNSDEMRRIRTAARENSIYVSLGYSEIDHASLYLAQVMIAPSGEVINHRRKIKATHVERLIFGDAPGDAFESVVQTDIGRVGHLNCWENLNPFLKAYSAAAGEQVHIAAWPIYPDAGTLKYPDPYTNISDANSDIVSPSYAIETGTFVLAPFQRISAEGVKKNTPPGKEHEAPDRYNGHTRVFGPDGQKLADNPPKDQDGLVIVDIDLNEAHLSKALADLGGHYHRSDLVRLLVDTRRKDSITHLNGDSIVPTKTIDRVGLSKPLVVSKSDAGSGGQEAKASNGGASDFVEVK